jgi:peptidoglycan/LPS O-acetylase OafA/YrhL
MVRNNFLDCVRAIAALLVVSRHAGLLDGGFIGVSLFFCLSGFLIATLLLQIDDPLPENLGNFVFRRFMRIWPLMVCQLTATAVLMALDSSIDLWGHLQFLPGLLTFTSTSLPNLGLSMGVLWSLQAEFWFYILMAIVVLFAGRAVLPWVAAIGFCVAWLAKLDAFSVSFFPWRNTLVHLDQLMVGVLCACAAQYRGRLVSAVFSNRALCLWAPFAAILVLSTIRFNGDLAFHIAMSASAYLTAAIILHQCARPLRGDFEPLAGLGRISYSIYLVHAVIFEFVSWHIFPPALRFFFMTGLAILISVATYRWVELPFIAWSKRAPVFGRRRIAASPITSRAP